jgi:signal transduction histidine kinase
MTFNDGKWRPSLSSVVAGVCAVLVILPLFLIVALQLGTNRFLHETEKTLLHQAALYASAYAEAFEAATRASGEVTMPGYYLPPDKRVFWNARSRTFAPLLDLRSDRMAEPAPAPKATGMPPAPRYLAVAPILEKLKDRASPVTLSSVQFLDHEGRDIQNSDTLNYAALPEVQKALRAELGAAIRRRGDVSGHFSLTRFGRGTGYRVFLAYPVISENRVIGAVLLSRTPSNLVDYMVEERSALFILLTATIAGALLTGTALVRVVLRPLRTLRIYSRQVAAGANESLPPQDRFGLREIAELGQSVRSMSETLASRAKEIGIYTDHVTHELKSPVTSISGAAELLSDPGLADETRQELIDTIAIQTARMDQLLKALREMARARHSVRGGPARLVEMKPKMPELLLSLDDPDALVPLSVQHGKTVLTHLLQNAYNHDATRAEISWANQILRIADNGGGFPEGDLTRLSDPFFTTRREEGGTGMGLAISATLLALYGADLVPVRAAKGAVVEIRFPGSPRI